MHLPAGQFDGQGSKMGLDAPTKWPGETSREWGRTLQMTPEVTAQIEEVWQDLGL